MINHKKTGESAVKEFYSGSPVFVYAARLEVTKWS